MFDNLINIISSSLENLPGKKVQYKMAPSDRELRVTIKKTKKSAVLVLLTEKQNDIYITFIKRQEYNGVHSGQIAFPGGKHEKNDTNLTETVYRETEEEIGVSRNKIEIIGELSKLFIPVSAFDVHPFIAFTKEKLIYKKQDYEVKEVFELKLSDFSKASNIKTETVNKNDIDITIPFYLIDGYKIWGATAMIISELIELVRNKN